MHIGREGLGLGRPKAFWHFANRVVYGYFERIRLGF
jgi:hypothetical protein